MAATLKNIKKPREIAVEVRVRVLKGIANPGLRRQIHDPPRFLRLEQRLDPITIAQIHLHEPEPRAARQLRQSRFL
jgi:hypothetical protein